MKDGAMSEITLTINGKEAKGYRGETILAVCERAGVDVPTLCHFPGLHDVGTCRMCIVETQGGRLATACSTPAEPGMTVTTESERLTALRRKTLELLFSERNHYCMFCEASGDCELQALAYRYGMDNVRYPGLYPRVETDTSHEHKVLDQNRCILCRRCVRACSEMVANHCLGIKDRGIESMLKADGGETLELSSCVSCGTCVQVCPTGALFDKRSAYRGREKDCTLVASTCPECSLGCPVELVARSGQVLRVDAHMGEGRLGILCKKGRYESLDGTRERVLAPMVRKGGKLQAAEWNEALAATRAGLGKVGAAHGASRVVGLASARLDTAALTGMRTFFETVLDSTSVAALGAAAVTDTAPAATLQDLLAADLILLAGENVGAAHQVVEFLTMRAYEQSGADLVLIGSANKRITKRAKVHVPAEGAGLMPALEAIADAGNPAGAVLASAKRPVFVFGRGIGDTAVTRLATAADAGWPRVLRLGAKANSLGAAAAGLSGNSIDLSGAKALFLLAGDDAEVAETALAGRGSLEFLVVQSAYRTALTDAADVVLPAPLWVEKSGTMLSSQGQEVALQAALPAPAGVRSEAEVLAALTA